MNSAELSDLIIEYQLKHSLTDNGLAFASHLPVELIHSMKVGEDSASDDEMEQILKYMQEN